MNLRELIHRLTAHAGMKIGLSIGLTSFFCLFYFGLQKISFFPARRLPLTDFEAWIGYRPHWTWVYQSIYGLLSLYPWLSTSREDLRRYTRGFFLLSGISFAIFLIIPVEAPRPDPFPEALMQRLLGEYNGRLNAFPSLHAGLLTYTLLFASRTLASPGLTAIGAVWGGLVLFATLATRLHYVVDLPAGMFLAWACHQMVWTNKTACSMETAANSIPNGKEVSP
jgi:hypothetical protein